MERVYCAIVNFIINKCAAIEYMAGRILESMRSLWRRITCQKEILKPIVLLVVGLDNSGKSSIVNYLYDKSLLTPENVYISTVGFRTVTFKYKKFSIRIYDIGGGPQIRALWPKYYGDVHGVIYVVDANDHDRLRESTDVFQQLVCHDLISGKPILFFGNKQDLDYALGEYHLIRMMNIEGIVNFAKCLTRVELCSCYLNKTFNRNKNFNLNKTMDKGFDWLIFIIEDYYDKIENRINEDKTKVRRKSSGFKSWTAESIDNSFVYSDSDSDSYYLRPIVPERPLAAKNKKKRKSLKNIFTISHNRTAPLPDRNVPTTQSMKELISSISIEDLINNTHTDENAILEYRRPNVRPKKRPNTAPAVVKPFVIKSAENVEPAGSNVQT